MEKKITLNQLLRNWIIVYVGNFVGSVFLAFMVSQSGLLSTSGGLLGATVINAAIGKATLPFIQAVVRGFYVIL